jgi:hypothetical protein
MLLFLLLLLPLPASSVSLVSFPPHNPASSHKLLLIPENSKIQCWGVLQKHAVHDIVHNKLRILSQLKGRQHKDTTVISYAETAGNWSMLKFAPGTSRLQYRASRSITRQYLHMRPPPHIPSPFTDNCYWTTTIITDCPKTKQTPWSESASELYRPSDHRLSAKWLPTFADEGCHVVSVTDP